MTSKAFRSYDLGQALLLPPSLDDWLPDDHLARFVAEVVATMDLTAFYASYRDGRGMAAYHPQLMVSLLVYGYCVGIRSSRKLEQACIEHVAFRYLSANAAPKHSAIAEFRRRHLTAMETLFAQVFELCREAGLVSLGHVSIDGSKIRANASKHKAVSWGRLEEREAHYRALAEELLKDAEACDSAEDATDNDDDSDLPQDWRRAEGRRARLQEAKEALQQRARERAREHAERQQAKCDAIDERERETGSKHRGRRPSVPDPDLAEPSDRDQYNFTDPDSRIMKDGATKAFQQSYNAQIGVDADHGVIVGTYVTDHTNDKRELLPAVAAIAANNDGTLPSIISADNGYYSDEAISAPELAAIDLYVPPDGARRKAGRVSAVDPEQDPPPDDDAPPAERMRHKLNSDHGRKVYQMRKAIAEGPFGIIKEAMGFRRFSVRGFAAVSGEWNLVTAAYNLRKLFRANKQAMIA